MNELELIEKVKKDKDSAALSDLVEMHSGILHNIIKKHSIPYKALTNFDELFANRYFITYQAAITYPENCKWKFNTHVGRVAAWDCCRQMKDLMNMDELNVEDNVLELEKDAREWYNDPKGAAIDEYLKLLEGDERLIKIFKLRCENGKTWTAIGKEIFLSHTQSYNLFVGGLKLIRKKLEKKKVLV